MKPWHSDVLYMLAVSPSFHLIRGFHNNNKVIGLANIMETPFLIQDSNAPSISQKPIS